MKPVAVEHLARIASRCIHCGLCLEECPTYLELGNEMDSPRGRILLLRSLVEGQRAPTPTIRKHLDLCLDCRACEAACPSGVHYGELIEEGRRELRTGGALTVLPHGAQSPPAAPETAPPGRTISDRILDFVLFRITPYPRRLRWALRADRLAKNVGLQSALLRLFPKLRKLMEMRPAGGSAAAPRIRADAQPRGAGRASAFLFTGCATSVLTPHTVENTQRVLLHNGCRVLCPGSQNCCGAIHYHGGRVYEAIKLAKRNIAAFHDAEASPATGAPVSNAKATGARIVTLAAGCSAMLRSYGSLFADDPAWSANAATFAARVVDVSEFLVALGPVPPTRSLARKITYHDACHHVHAQGIRSAPRKLLAMIPGVEFIEAPESQVCCGAAGTYNLTQPETASRLGRRKLNNLWATDAQCAATGNVGCILHLNGLVRDTANESGNVASRITDDFVRHTIDLLAAAYGLS